MKQIVSLYQGGLLIQVAQCLRCKEVFTVAVPQDAQRPWDAVGALDESHKAECSKILVRFDEAENGG